LWAAYRSDAKFLPCIRHEPGIEPVVGITLGVYFAHQGNYCGPVFRWLAPYWVKAVDLGASVAPRNSRKKTFLKGRNTLSEEAKKIKQPEQEVEASQLSERELDNVAGGASNAVKGIDIIVKKKTHL
jgi:hypothetical protein